MLRLDSCWTQEQNTDRTGVGVMNRFIWSRPGVRQGAGWRVGSIRLEGVRPAGWRCWPTKQKGKRKQQENKRLVIWILEPCMNNYHWSLMHDLATTAGKTGAFEGELMSWCRPGVKWTVEFSRQSTETNMGCGRHMGRTHSRRAVAMTNHFALNRISKHMLSVHIRQFIHSWPDLVIKNPIKWKGSSQPPRDMMNVAGLHLVMCLCCGSFWFYSLAKGIFPVFG
jgi:hypothetical protein